MTPEEIRKKIAEIDAELDARLKALDKECKMYEYGLWACIGLMITIPVIYCLLT